MFSSAAPSGDWNLSLASGATAPRSSSFGWASRYAVPAAATGTLHFDDGPWPLLAGIFSVLVWGLALAALVDRRRIRREWERVGRPAGLVTRTHADVRGPGGRLGDGRGGARMTGPTDGGPGDEDAVTGNGSGPGTDPLEGAATGPVVVSRIARRRQAQRPVAGRTAALVAAALVVVGVGITSLAVPPPAPAPAPTMGEGIQVAPTDAQVSSFFCASGAGLDAGAGATGVVVLTNTAHTAVHGVMATVDGSGSARVRREVTVPALGSTDVNPATGMPAGATASTFSFAGGGVTGTMVVNGPSGWSTAPCASAVSSRWNFAGGSTATGLLDLSLYNPTAAQAVVDVSFLTPGGALLVPQAYQGITLAPGQLVVAGLSAYVQNQSEVATMVQTSAGAVVATELDRLSVPSGSGLALLSGTPEPASTWRFGQTTAVQGGNVTLVIANPGQSAVMVEVSVGLAAVTVTPRQLDVAPLTVTTLTVSSVAGWPLGSPYSLTVSASSPIIVGRSVSAPSGAGPPQAGTARGTTSTASSWLVVGPGSPSNPLATGASIRSLAVADPGSTPVEVTVVPLAGGRPVAMARVTGDSVVVFGSASVGGLRPLVVEATGPVVVEADDGPTGAPGVVSMSGFPLAG